MKAKLVPLLLIVCLTLTACGSSGRPMSEQYRKYGEKMLEITDRYLDFELSLDAAYQQIKDVESARASIPDATDEELARGDRAMSVCTMALSWDFVCALTDSSAAKKILEDRNDLARLLGKPER